MYRVADVEHVFHLRHAFGRELADVHEAFLTRKNLDERADRNHPLDRAGVDLTDLDVLGDVLDVLLRGFTARSIERGDEHRAVVLDVDLLDTGFGDDLVDDLAAWSDDVFDLVGIDLDHDHPRRVLGEFRTRLRDRFRELIDDEEARLLGLRHCFAHDLNRDALDFDVHLDRGDTFLGTRNFEVHLAKCIFEALNVGED